MEKQRLVALGFAFASFLLAVSFGVMTAVCGAMEQGASTDVEAGRTVSYGPRCVSAFHPFAAVWAVLAGLGMASLAWWRAWPVLVLGGLGLALGILSGFSAGLYGIGCGVLLLAAGVVAAGSGGRRGQGQGGGPPNRSSPEPPDEAPPEPRRRSHSASSGPAVRVSS